MSERTPATGRSAGPPLEDGRGTLVRLFREGAGRQRDANAMLERRPGGSWKSFSREAVSEEVRALALGLRSLGFERGDRVAIISRTRREWAVTDYALIMAGLVSVPVYPTLPPDQMAHILADAGVRGIFAENDEICGKVAEIRDELPGAERLFLFDPASSPAGRDAMSLGELHDRGEKAPELAPGYESRARATEPDDLATLIYTSGTTGRPKGVMLTHQNLYSNVVACRSVLSLSERDRVLSWLPLAHVFERLAGHYLMWRGGPAIAYAESVHTVVRDMEAVRPTIMTAIPRLYEKFYEGATSAARSGGFVKERIFEWAKKVGEERADHLLGGDPVGPWLTARYALADLLVFKKLRDRTGGQVRYFVSGGGALPPAVGRFFWAAGLPILEGYGLTETSPVLTVNPPHGARLGTVGLPVPGTELRIAGDGEILCRGPQVMKGYHRNEDATREVLSDDGWLRTGDIGRIDPDGYLRITDRKKEIIVTSYGKNIAPRPIESAIERSRFVEHAVLIGDRRKFPIVLLVPEFEVLAEWAAGKEIAETRPQRLIRNPRVTRLLDSEVEEATARFAEHERPGAVLRVRGPFGVESGELTPTLKVKRRVVVERYADEIDRAYEEAERAKAGGA